MNHTHRIYAACLASYNAGTLHGTWIDCDRADVDDLQEAVSAMLAASPVAGAEEFAIHDSEGFGRLVGDYTPLEEVALIAAADGTAFRWLVEDRGMSVREAADRAENVTVVDVDQGQSVERMLGDYAAELTDLDGVPEHLRGYIDFEAMGHDLRLGGDVDTFEHDGTTYIISNAAEF